MRGALLFALAAGCHFDGGLGTGLLCPSGECPAGQTCVDGTCAVAGGPVDAASSADGPASTSDGATPMTDASIGVNLVTNPGMEEGIDPWTPFNATVEASSDKHGGAASLRVCAETSGDFTVYQDVIKSPPDNIAAGIGYAASIWVRATGASEVPVMMKLTIRESGGASERGDHDGTVVSGLTTSWVKLEASGIVQEADRENLILIVWALESPATACFNADDAVMREVN